MSDPCGIVDAIQDSMDFGSIPCHPVASIEAGAPSENDNRNDNRNEKAATTGEAGDSPPEGCPPEEESPGAATPPPMAAVSDLSDPSRRIYVVTTAALPWRTGTAVNPLARALFLTRGRPRHAVTLMVPWLASAREQASVYGSNVFETPEEQEAWIRDYSRERILTGCEGEGDSENGSSSGDDINDNDSNINSNNNINNNVNDDDEVDKLRISFYPAKFHKLLGSIFATVDICALIPPEEADVAILEEPEHLTWFRSLPPSTRKRKNHSSQDAESSCATASAASAMDSIMDHDSSCGACTTTGSELERQQEGDGTGEDQHTSNKSNGHAVAGQDDEDDDELLDETRQKMEERAVIGWTAKFRYVVGILHTNYSAYMRQYGLGASLVTASALHALSAVCVRAYTHRLIRLSDTLPELDAPREVTRNVHGVRPEFFVRETPASTKVPSLAPAQARDLPALADAEADDDHHHEGNGDEGNEIGTKEAGEAPPDDEQETAAEEGTDGDGFLPEPIYFIGKVIWAKGFDKLLEIEDLYRKETGEYFPIDVYGSGADLDAITRAFLGRTGLAKKTLSSASIASLDGARSPREGSGSPVPPAAKSSPEDKTAALLFSREGSLRGQIENGQAVPSDELVVEVQTRESAPRTEAGRRHPKQVVAHLGEKTAETTSKVTSAIATLGVKLSSMGFRSLYSEEPEDASGSSGSGCTFSDDPPSSGGGSGGLVGKFRFDPPRSRYELRLNPVPARFLGVRDHAVLRDVSGHRVFLNPSVTEVLCTTTAEALAMGKFVVVPRHPSNTFFLQFPNCLAYDTKKECVDHLRYALRSDPVPLSRADRHKLTWEGANARLFESAMMTEEEAGERNKKTGDAARLHIDTMRTGAFFSGLWARGKTIQKHIALKERPEEKPEPTGESGSEPPKGPATGFCRV